MKHPSHLAFAVAILLLLLFACTPQAAEPTTQPTVVVEEEAPLATATLEATNTPAATDTPVPPTATATASATVIPTLALEPMTAASLPGLSVLQQWGRGTIQNSAYSPDGSTLALATRSGIYLLDADTMEERLYINNQVIAGSLAFSPDGKTVAAPGPERTVWLWDAATGEELASFAGHTDVVTGIAFSPDGKALAAGSLDGNVISWAIESNEVLFKITGGGGIVHDVAYSRDGRYLASGGPGVLSVWAAGTGSKIKQAFDLPGDVFQLEFTPSGMLAAAAYSDVVVLDPETFEAVAAYGGMSMGVKSFALAADGPLLAATQGDGLVHLFDMETKGYLGNLGKATEEDSLIFEPTSLAFRPGKDELFSSLFGIEAKVWNPHTRRLLASAKDTPTLAGFRDEVPAVALSPDGRLAAVIRGAEVDLIDTSTGEIVRSLPGNSGAVKDVAFDASGHFLAVGTEEMKAIVWDAESGKMRYTLEDITGGVNCVAFSPAEAGAESQYLATGSRRGTVSVWNAADGEHLDTFRDHENAITDLAFASSKAWEDGFMLASSSMDESVRVYDLSSGYEAAHLKNMGGSVYNLAFSPDGQFLAVGGYGGQVRFYETGGWNLHSQLPRFNTAVTVLDYSAGLLVVGLFNGDLLFFDPASENAEVFRLHIHNGSIEDLAFTPDGRMAASASNDGRVRLWGVQHGGD